MDTLILSEEQAVQARQTREHYRRQLATLDAEPPPNKKLQAIEHDHLANMLAMLERLIAMWDANIREPVPDQPRSIDSPITSEAMEAMTEDEYHAFARQMDALLKRAQVENIDRQIGIALDRIADWRRRRAWLEREIAELEQAVPQQQPTPA